MKVGRCRMEHGVTVWCWVLLTSKALVQKHDARAKPGLLLLLRSCDWSSVSLLARACPHLLRRLESRHVASYFIFPRDWIDWYGESNRGSGIGNASNVNWMRIVLSMTWTTVLLWGLRFKESPYVTEWDQGFLAAFLVEALSGLFNVNYFSCAFFNKLFTGCPSTRVCGLQNTCMSKKFVFNLIVLQASWSWPWLSWLQTVSQLWRWDCWDLACLCSQSLQFTIQIIFLAWRCPYLIHRSILDSRRACKLLLSILNQMLSDLFIDKVLYHLKRVRMTCLNQVVLVHLYLLCAWMSHLAYHWLHEHRMH